MALENLPEAKNFFIVDIQNKKGKIIVSIDSYKGIKLDECVNVNRGLRNLFAGELDEYELEVTSPGLSEPLKVYQQYEKNVGKKVEVLLKQDRKKISGKLLDVDDRGIKLEEKKRIKTEKNKKKTVREEYSIDFDDIEYTKPVISF